jgi:hypothetical protein
VACGDRQTHSGHRAMLSRRNAANRCSMCPELAGSGKGVDLVGLLPSDLQSHFINTAGVGTAPLAGRTRIKASCEVQPGHTARGVKDVLAYRKPRFVD